MNAAARPRPESPALLHNIGYAPQATLSWRGLNRGEISNGKTRLRLAGQTGTWLNCRCVINSDHPQYGHDWNNARALLRLLDRKHDLEEEQARQALLERIESHCQGLNWSAYLVAEPTKKLAGGPDNLTLDHPLTAFVALSKSTGSLWMRDRPARLAPLHTPIDTNGSSGIDPCIQWSTRLWFPHGIPENLLTALTKKTAPKFPKKPA